LETLENIDGKGPARLEILGSLQLEDGLTADLIDAQRSRKHFDQPMGHSFMYRLFFQPYLVT